MAGTTSSRFFWPDWMSDPGIRASCHAARGLWMDMLCLMAMNEPPGYLQMAGAPMTVAQLAGITGGLTPALTQALLDELEKNAVFSRNGRGCIYSRRMVREAKLAAVSRKNGKMGGNPKLGKQKVNGNQDNPSPTGGLDPGRATLLPLPIPDSSSEGENSDTPSQATKTENPETVVRRLKKPPDGFDGWYALYPRKAGKGAARKAFAGALLKIDLATLTERTCAYADGRRGQDENYTPHPATWLNGERWADDPARPFPDGSNGSGGPKGYGNSATGWVAAVYHAHIEGKHEDSLPTGGGIHGAVSGVRVNGARQRPGPLPGPDPGETVIEAGIESGDRSASGASEGEDAKTI